jgi:lysine-N-methylase
MNGAISSTDYARCNMKVRVPQYYDVFSCIGGSCPDTCCVGWMIEIDEKSYQRFKNQEGEFGQRIRDNIIDRSDGHFFALNEQGRCAFLNKDNLCDMVIRMGDEGLCSLCDNYPRIGEEFGGLRELGLSISCPEVASLILSSSKPIKFGEWENGEQAESVDYTKDMVFNLLMQLRDVVFGIIQNRELSVMHRIAVYIMLASQLQNIIDNDENTVSELEKLIAAFSDENYINKLVSAIRKSDYAAARAGMAEILSFIDGLEIINEKWTALHTNTVDYIQKTGQDEYAADHEEFAGYFEKYSYVFEHLAVYYVYRYFMKVVFDGDIYSKAVICAVCVLVTMEMNVAYWKKNNKSFKLEDEIKIIYLYSKEIEHCEENMQRFYNEFWDNDLYQPKSIIDIMTEIIHN